MKSTATTHIHSHWLIMFIHSMHMVHMLYMKIVSGYVDSVDTCTFSITNTVNM